MKPIFRLPGSALFSAPSMPTLPPPAPVPTPDDPEVEAARRKRLLAEKRRRGSLASRLTRPSQRLGEDAPTGRGTITRPTLG